MWEVRGEAWERGIACAPVGISNYGGMAAEKGNNVRDFALFVQRDDSEGASTTGLPIDSKIFGVGLEGWFWSAEITKTESESENVRKGEKGVGDHTLTKLVSQAFLLMRILS